MGMFSMCPACGSDYCSNCDCVRDKLSTQIKTLQQRVAALSVPSSPPEPKWCQVCRDVHRSDEAHVGALASVPSSWQLIDKWQVEAEACRLDASIGMALIAITLERCAIELRLALPAAPPQEPTR